MAFARNLPSMPTTAGAGRLMALLVLLVAPVSADTVHLKEGGTIVGTITDYQDAIVVETPYGVSTVPRSHIDRIEWDPLELEPFDPASVDELEALLEVAGSNYEKGLAAIQASRDDELVSGRHRLVALHHLETARDAYQEVGEREPAKAEFVTRRLNEINSQIFWCNRFGALSDLGLDASGRKLDEQAREAAEARAEEEAALAALDEARTFHVEHPDRLGEVMGRYLDVIEQYPGTQAAATARQRIEEVQDQLVAGAQEPQGTRNGPPKAGPGEPPPQQPRQTLEEIRAELLASLTREATVGSYLIKADGGYEEGFCEEVGNTLQACADLVATFTGLKRKREAASLEVLVFTSKEQMLRYAGGPRADGNPARQLLAAQAQTPGVVLDPATNQLYAHDSSKLHEELRRSMPQQYLREFLQEPLPSFLTEGLGHYLSLAVLDRGGTRIKGSELDQTLLASLGRATAPLGGRAWRRALGGSEGLLPLEEVVTSTEVATTTIEDEVTRRIRSELRVGNREQLLRGQRWLLCYWCLNGKGPGKALAAFCKSLAQEGSPHEAYRRTLGRANSSGKMDEAFEDYVKDLTR